MLIKRMILIISILGIIFTIVLLSRDVYVDYYVDSTMKDSIYNYINKIDNSNLKGVLEIPAINLKTGIVDNVDEGIMFVNDRLIAGHSGNCKVCYFDALENLEIGDNVYLYQNNEVEYKVDTIKEVDKNHVYINGDLNLITCKKTDKDRRLIIVLKKMREKV